jgi:hypothetical protein
MKKVFGAIMSLVLLAGAALPAWAQTSRAGYAQRTAQQRRYDNSRRADYDRYSQRDYDGRYDRRDDDRSVWDKSRDKLTVAAGAGAGAVVGGVVGGKKGAIIGALLGAGGSALYTYGIRDRDDRDGRRYQRRR